jgi:hypothetical protein
MYLLKLLVFQGIQLLVRSTESSVSTHGSSDPLERNGNIDSIDTSAADSLENTLINTVNNYYNYYYNHIKEKKSLKNNILGTEDGELNGKHIVALQLEFNIFIVLLHLYGYYLKILPEENAVLRDRYLENEIIDLLQSYYVEAICSLTPRCFDFIYIYAYSFLNFGKLFKLHTNLCYSRKVYLTKYHIQGNIDNIELLSSTNIQYKRIQSLYKQIFKEKLIALEIKPNTLRNDETFIKTIFEIINKIDKKNTIQSSDWRNKFILKDHFSSPEFEKLFPDNLKLTFESSQPQSQVLSNNLKKIIDNNEIMLFHIEIDEHVTKSVVSSEKKYNLLLSKLLLYFIKGIEIYFRKEVFSQNYDKLEKQTISIDDETIKNLISMDNMLDKVCKHIPLILYHLIINEIHNSNLINLYLTICSDWLNFLNVRCLCDKSEKRKMLYNLQCVRQSVNEKLLLNYLMIKETTSYDDYLKNNLPEKELLVSTIQTIHSELDTYYEPEKINVWSSFDWLSGVHVFTETQYSDYLNSVQNWIGTLDEENVPLIEMYNQLLPWNLNIGTVLGFKLITDNCFTLILNNFYYRQITIVVFYIKFNNINHFDDKVIQRLKKYFDPYEKGKQQLYNFMSLTDKTFTFIDVVKIMIENLKLQNFAKIAAMVDSEFYKQLFNAYNLLSNRKTKFETHLNKIFLKNCYNIVHFINTYFSIVQKSKLITNDFLNSNTCKNNDLDSIFTIIPS